MQIMQKIMLGLSLLYGISVFSSDDKRKKMHNKRKKMQGRQSLNLYNSKQLNNSLELESDSYSKKLPLNSNVMINNIFGTDLPTYRFSNFKKIKKSGEK